MMIKGDFGNLMGLRLLCPIECNKVIFVGHMYVCMYVCMDGWMCHAFVSEQLIHILYSLACRWQWPRGLRAAAHQLRQDKH
jgi:hypothetical protein